MKKINSHLTIIILTGLLIGVIASTDYARADIHLDKSNFYHVGNVTFNVTDNLYFFHLIQTSNYMEFNSSKFYVTAPNTTNITLDFMNQTMFAPDTNSRLIAFYANTTTGLVSFRISGFLSDTDYDIYRDGAFLSTATSDATGHILFTNSTWTTSHYFEIYTTRGLFPISSTIIGGNNGIIISILGGLTLCFGVTYYFVYHRRRRTHT